MIAYRTITEEEYNLFNNKYISALNDLINKEKKYIDDINTLKTNLKTETNNKENLINDLNKKLKN
jgi:hypothetical protein